MAGDRKLPVYLLIDISAAMSGTAIDSVNNAIADLKHQLVSSPETLENCLVSLVLFNEIAKLYAFTPIDEFDPPVLVASGGRSLGAALHALVESLQQDVEGLRVGSRSEQRPLVVMIIGGSPTDDYLRDLDTLAALPAEQRPTYVVLVCGQEVDMSILKPLGAITIPAPVVTPEILVQAFGVVAQTIIRTSRAVPRDSLVPPLNSGN